MITDILNRIALKFGIEHHRSFEIYKNIIYSAILKFLSILSNFLLVPITINFLNNDKYGVWLTLTSFIGWFSLFDGGLGNGLRNKLAKAISDKNQDLAQAYVSSAYYTIGAISIILILTFLIINPFINWESFFNTNNDVHRFKLILPIVFSFFLIQLTLKLVVTIYTADQKSSMIDLVQFLTQFLTLISIWGLTFFSESSLLSYGLVFSSIPIIVLLLISTIAFKKDYAHFKPKFSLWKIKYLKEISGVGFQFFILQIAALMLFSTDNIIISKLFTPEEVVPYNITYKYFSILTVVFTVLLTPFWSSFTEAFHKKDNLWIKRSIKNLMKLWLLVPVMLVIFLFFSENFYTLWVGDTINISKELNYGMALFVLITTFNSIFVYFVNGVGKIKIQLISAFISLILNIPISYFLAKTLNMGITGVILATSICTGYLSILLPIQYLKIINGKAKGIWNK